MTSIRWQKQVTETGHIITVTGQTQSCPCLQLLELNTQVPSPFCTHTHTRTHTHTHTHQTHTREDTNQPATYVRQLSEEAQEFQLWLTYNLPRPALAHFAHIYGGCVYCLGWNNCLNGIHDVSFMLGSIHGAFLSIIY